MQPNQYQEEITTPIGGHKVIIKTMLTAVERETVELAPLDFAETQDFEKFDIKDTRKAALAKRHALLKASVVSIDSDPANCFERLQKMFDQDYDFVLAEIDKHQKKGHRPTSEISS